MDDAKKEALDRALTMLVDSLEQGKEFVIEQAPLVVQELVCVGFVKHGICAVTCAVLAIVLAVIAYKALGWCKRQMKEHPHSCNEVPGFCFVFAPAAIGSVALLTIAASEGAWFLEAWLAPRVYIIHSLKEVL